MKEISIKKFEKNKNWKKQTNHGNCCVKSERTECEYCPCPDRLYNEWFRAILAKFEFEKKNYKCFRKLTSEKN